MPPLAVCAVTDDEHVEDVVAVARWLEDAQAFTPRYLHVLRGMPVAGMAQVVEPVDDAAFVSLVPGGEVEMLCGETASVLERRAEELGAALFVVGSRGRGTVASALSGSVSRVLLTRGTRPVLVARHGSAPEVGAGPVVCGVTRPEAHAQRVARAAAGLARRLERPLLLATVVADAIGAQVELEADVDAAAGFLERLGTWLDVPCGVTQRVLAGPPAAALAEVAGEERSALLVVGCRGLGVFGTMMEGSVSRTLIRHACRPLVVVPLRPSQ
jgi:nucleotide-binding universal stress UspA family protein